MPELPEVETIRRDLAPLVVGRQVVDLTVDEATLPLLAGTSASLEALRSSLRGRTITAIERAGKYLLFEMDDGHTWVVHLRMTGRLVWRRTGDPPEPYERASVTFDDGHELRWSDLRKFGTWRVVADSSVVRAGLGPEPLEGTMTPRDFRRAVEGRRAPIKSVLLDQRRLAGIGNIYADEALFAARIRPDAPAADLSRGATMRLFKACQAVLEQGIANRGASFRDYVDAQGQAGQQHMYVQVFRRTGKPCYHCGTAIERTVLGGRATHFCPRCQRRPRREVHRDR